LKDILGRPFYCRFGKVSLHDHPGNLWEPSVSTWFTTYGILHCRNQLTGGQFDYGNLIVKWKYGLERDPDYRRTSDRSFNLLKDEDENA
jgi:hypothetical protein